MYIYMYIYIYINNAYQNHPIIYSVSLLAYSDPAKQDLVRLGISRSWLKVAGGPKASE